jgi:hypothetical protein
MPAQRKHSAPARSAQPSKASKKFCRVCFDAAKNEEEYTSHYVKDRPGDDGIVVCPFLLEQECRYCHLTGHTRAYCTKLKRDEKENVRREKDAARAARTTAYETAEQGLKNTKKQTTQANAFAWLANDDESESDNERKSDRKVKSSRARSVVTPPREEYPVLAPLPVRAHKTNAAKSYSEMAAKEPVSPYFKPIFPEVGEKIAYSAQEEEPVYMRESSSPLTISSLMKKSLRSWDDDTDDEDCGKIAPWAATFGTPANDAW